MGPMGMPGAPGPFGKRVSELISNRFKKKKKVCLLRNQ